jgi:putative restriction endonuclease
MHQDPDWPIRIAAINALQRLVQQYGEVLPWELIDAGFSYQGETLHFANRARGIFWPGRCAKRRCPSRPRDNRRLVRAMELDAPLIYFYGIEPGAYRPIWPVYISEVDPAALSFTVVSAAPEAQVKEPGRYAADPKLLSLERRYATVQVKKRLHQVAFRRQVLRAYEQRCAVCRFPRTELPDAAHILPDRDVRGHPEVPNGLSLCKLHHGAFDANLLGIRPDGIIEISRQLLDAQDGPTLEHGLKGFASKRLGMLPAALELRPRGEYLEERYERFRKAG